MPAQTTNEPGTPRPWGRGPTSDGLAFARRVLIATRVIVSVGLLLALVWYPADLLMLVFAGGLVSILLRPLAALVRKMTGLGHSLSLAIVTLALASIVAMFAWLVANGVATQATELTERVRAALATLSERLGGYEWAHQLFDGLPSLSEFILSRGGVLSHLPGIAATTLGVIASAAVLIVVGVYLASQPTLYSDGIEHLLPFSARPRSGEVLEALDDALGRWLLGRFGLMVINGGLTTLALWLLGVPLAVILGLIAGLLNVVANFGPFIAAVSAVLVAFVQSPHTALDTASAYLFVPMVDGYVLTHSSIARASSSHQS